MATTVRNFTMNLYNSIVTIQAYVKFYRHANF